MGDFDGGVRHFWRGIQQLCVATGREPGDSRGCVRSGLSASAGAAFICNYFAAGKDPAGAGNGQKDVEFGLISEDGALVTGRVPAACKWIFLPYLFGKVLKI